MGLLSQLAGGFTGSGAKKQLNQGIAAVGQGKTAAQGYYNAGETEAQGYLKPYREQGERFNALWGDAYGVNGPEGMGRAAGLYGSNNPLMTIDALRRKQSDWRTNARGHYGDATGQLARERVSQEGYERWLGGVERGAMAGGQAARDSAGIAQWGAGGRAGAEMTGANALASLYGQKAQNENTFAQNLLGLGGLAVQAYTGMPVPKKQGNNIGGSGGAP